MVLLLAGRCYVHVTELKLEPFCPPQEALSKGKSKKIMFLAENHGLSGVLREIVAKFCARYTPKSGHFILLPIKLCFCMA